jgi:hypothetical protein
LHFILGGRPGLLLAAHDGQGPFELIDLIVLHLEAGVGEERRVKGLHSLKGKLRPLNLHPALRHRLPRLGLTNPRVGFPKVVERLPNLKVPVVQVIRLNPYGAPFPCACGPTGRSRHRNLGHRILPTVRAGSRHAGPVPAACLANASRGGVHVPPGRFDRRIRFQDLLHHGLHRE